MKGKAFKVVSAAKYHTVVLSSEGEVNIWHNHPILPNEFCYHHFMLMFIVEFKVFTWGHRQVNPRRVIVARSLKKSGTTLLKFHRMERLHVISVAAGMTYSSALTDDGALFYWTSSDPDLRCEQVCFLH